MKKNITPSSNRVAAMAMALTLVTACADQGPSDSQSLTSDQVIAARRYHRADLVITATATVTTTSASTRTLHVHVQNTGFGGAVDDVRLHIQVRGDATLVLPLPTVEYMTDGSAGCTSQATIECLLGWLDGPPDSPTEQPSSADLDFNFEVNINNGDSPPTVAITVDNSIGGGYDERAVDINPENNIVTVEL